MLEPGPDRLSECTQVSSVPAISSSLCDHESRNRRRYVRCSAPVQMPVMLTVQSSSLDFAYIRAIQLQQADVDRPDLHAHWRGSTMSGM